MLRGKPTVIAPTLAAVKTNNNRNQAIAPRAGIDNKTGGNTFAGAPTAAVTRTMNQGARR